MVGNRRIVGAVLALACHPLRSTAKVVWLTMLKPTTSAVKIAARRRVGAKSQHYDYGNFTYFRL